MRVMRRTLARRQAITSAGIMRSSVVFCCVGLEVSVRNAHHLILRHKHRLKFDGAAQSVKNKHGHSSMIGLVSVMSTCSPAHRYPMVSVICMLYI